MDEDGKIKHDPGVKTAEQGAATSVWCATSAQLSGKGGVYCEDVLSPELLLPILPKILVFVPGLLMRSLLSSFGR